MFSRLVEKFRTFGDHHQVLITVVIAISIICFTWSFEKILEEYVFPHKPLRGYITLLVLAMILLWLTQHYILHAI